MPDHVEPDGGLRARAEQSAGSKQAGKGQSVDDGRCRREQISAGKQQQRARAGDRELRKQQNGGDHIVDRQRGLIARDECRDGGKRHAGKGHRACEQHRRDADHGQRGGAIATARRHGREKDVALVTRLHCRLRQTGSERAMAIAKNACKISSDAAGRPAGCTDGDRNRASCLQDGSPSLPSPGTARQVYVSLRWRCLNRNHPEV